MLEYLLGKCHVNLCQIKLLSSVDYKLKVSFLGHHFIRSYILNNPELGENTINKTILDGIFNCK